LDEHISPKVVEKCRASGINVRTAKEMKLAGAGDDVVFRAAIRDGRIVVTYNNGDFSRLFPDMLREHRAIPGVVLISADTIPPSDLGGLIRALTKLAGMISRGEADPSAGLFLRG
jgi:predicted nuclease of predicted toxin-antitoxin system